LLDFLDRLIKVFDGATDGIGDHDFFARFQDADRNGLIIAYTGSAPDPYRTKVSDLMQRLFSIRNSIMQAVAMAQNPQRTAAETSEERNRLNASVRDRIREAKDIRTEVSADVDRREREAAAAQ
jgi:hypothetical protein